VLIMERLYRQAEERGDSLAVAYGDQRLSWSELVECVERLAAGLRELGIEPGDSVALVLRDDPWFVMSFHAVTAIGAVVVPVNPAFKRAEIDFVFRATDVRAVISDERTAGVCEGIIASFDQQVDVITTTAGHGQSLTLEDLIERSTSERLPPRDPDETFMYQFSSGSTGRPKRVPRTHAQCSAEATLYGALPIDAEDRVLGVIPLFHTWGMGACLLAPAHWGTPLVILPDPHPFLLTRHHALELIERERITIFPGVPFNFQLMAQAPAKVDLSSLRLCFSAGIALPRDAFDAFGERFGVLVRQLYGSTETGAISANMSDDPVGTFESVGRPLGDVDLRIIDEDGEPMASMEIGEVSVRSPAMTTGYSNLPELNELAFADGRYRTGDLGFLSEDGSLTITGRAKLLIEVGGYKVDPIEVQDVVESHPAVHSAIVVGVPGSAPGQEAVKAVIVTDEACTDREIIAFCRDRVANYKVPQIIEFRDEIPTSPLGKVLRKYLV
jgi:long-chain acyl-CoA synthetase